jgi:ParB family chromosome partitioning protein
MTGMSVVPLDGRSVVPFDARQTYVKLAHLEGDLVRFRRLRDWPELERAVDAIMAEQASFVANWDIRVGPQGRHVSLAGHDLSAKEAFDLWGFNKQAVSRWRASLKEPESYRARLIVGSHRIANLEPAANHRAEGTGDNEWHTPPEHIEAARSVLGEIDLDPASSVIAQQTVQATNYYTRDDDALSKEWHGRVWLNPPYSQPAIGEFVQKLVGEFAAGRVSEAILLTHNYTDTAWFHLAASTAALIAFPRGRIYFINADGSTGRPTQGQAIFYFGTRDEAFRNTYAPLGLVVRRA